MTKTDEAKDRIEARRALIVAKLADLRAHAHPEAADLRGEMVERLAEIETTLGYGWDKLNDAAKARLDAWLARD